MDVIGAVAGLDQLFGGDVCHKGTAGRAGFTGVKLLGRSVAFDCDLHCIGPQINLSASRPFASTYILYVVPRVAHHHAVQRRSVGVKHNDENVMHTLVTAAV